MHEHLVVSSLSWIQELYEAAAAVRREKHALSESVKRRLTAALEALEKVVRSIPLERQETIIDLANQIHNDEDTLIDTDGLIYHNDEDGYWVQGGLFVSDAALEEAEEKEKERITTNGD